MSATVAVSTNPAAQPPDFANEFLTAQGFEIVVHRILHGLLTGSPTCCLALRSAAKLHRLRRLRPLHLIVGPLTPSESH
jgi:hypothetical protein